MPFMCKKNFVHFRQKMDVSRPILVSIIRCPKKVLAINQFGRKFVCIPLLCGCTGPQLFSKSSQELLYFFLKKLNLGCF